MDEKVKTKREEIEKLLTAGKTKEEIWKFTGYDRSYIWNVYKMWLGKEATKQ